MRSPRREMVASVADERPTKKQRELLSFIDGFIKGNGYGPSYREVMRALEYKSVSTVATHIDGLIVRGYLRKKTHSARSLEVVSSDSQPVVADPEEPDVLSELRQRSASLRRDPSELAQHQAEVLMQAIEIMTSPQ